MNTFKCHFCNEEIRNDVFAVYRHFSMFHPDNISPDFLGNSLEFKQMRFTAACAAMTGIMSNPDLVLEEWEKDIKEYKSCVVEAAVVMADALIAELGKVKDE